MTETNLLTVADLQHLSVMGPSWEQPFDKGLTIEEATHIRELFLPEQASQLKIVQSTRNGGDGETYRYVGIRRKDGSVPQRPAIKRVYSAFFRYSSGVGEHPNKGATAALLLVELLEELGADNSEGPTQTMRDLILRRK